MFERYTEKARRAIFFSRYEAGLSGSNYITPEHLLLGLLREPNPLWGHLGRVGDINVIRTEFGPEVPVAQRVPGNKEIPFSADAKQALQLAAEQADSLEHREVGTKHLLVGLLRIGDCRQFRF